MKTESAGSLTYSGYGKRLRSPEITRLMATALASPELLSLAAGFTDNETLPVESVREIVSQLLAGPDAAQFLQYGTNQGRPGLRELLARRISSQDRLPGDNAIAADQLMITNGSQQALALAMQVLCDPGDIVFVEKPTYFVYLDLLRGVGADIRNLPRTEENRIDAEAFGQILDRMNSAERARVKAIYLLGYFSNPATTTLTEKEKVDLATVLRKRGMLIPVLEDAAYRELFFEQLPEPRSILALDAFHGFPRLYLGTLTKPFASGLKTGFACCTDEDWFQRMLFLKGQHDFGTAHFLQAILEEALEKGHYEPQLTLLRETYLRKMQVLHNELMEAGLRELGWRWQIPEGGLYLWLEGPDGLDTGVESRFCERAVENGVLYVPGELCMGASPEKNFVRLSFGALPEERLREAGRRFAKTVREFAS